MYVIASVPELMVVIPVERGLRRTDEESLAFEKGFSQGVEKVYSIHIQEIQACKTALKNDPTNYWSWNKVALLQASFDLNAAIQFCTAGIKTTSHLTQLLVGTNLYAAKGDYSAAMDALLLNPRLMSEKIHLKLKEAQNSHERLASLSDSERSSLEE
jgi:hypothetical protein